MKVPLASILVGVAGAVLVATVCPAQVPKCDLVAGWTQQGSARAYEASNLFEYMDGNAEGYLLYGFVAMHGVTCVHGGDSILIDVSEFADGDSAYGMFSANRDPRLPAERWARAARSRRAGSSSPRAPSMRRWPPIRKRTTRRRCTPFPPRSRKLLPGSTAVPAALAWFPAEGQKSARLIPESVLGLRLLKRGYVAEYEFGKAFVVQEPSADEAAAVMDKLRARFGQTGDPLQLTDRYLGRLCFIRKGPYLVGYANVAEGHDPAALAAALAARVP